jgi:hypothetical protein
VTVSETSICLESRRLSSGQINLVHPSSACLRMRPRPRVDDYINFLGLTAQSCHALSTEGVGRYRIREPL